MPVRSHGLCRSHIYNVHRGMLARCRNPNANGYARYGGRGIKVCERWLCFENFLADMGPGKAGWSLDRIDNDGDYEPGNCWWATWQAQLNNRAVNRRIEFNGTVKTLTDWARALGVKPGTLHSRLGVHGWTVERAFTAPVRIVRPYER